MLVYQRTYISIRVLNESGVSVIIRQLSTPYLGFCRDIKNKNYYVVMAYLGIPGAWLSQ